MLKYVLTILIALTSPPASAMTGNELLEQCAAPDGSVEHKQCGSYIVGVMSGANMMMIGTKQLHEGSSAYPVLFCVTPSVPTAELIDVVVKYLRAHPGDRKYDAASEVLLSFREAFPCH
jgi:hypothetical protein